MGIWDCLLIAWWLLAAATIIPSALFTRRLRSGERKAAEISYLKGHWTGRYRMSFFVAALPRAVFWPLVISWIVLFVALTPLLLFSHWTTSLVLNLEVFIFLFGALSLWLGLSPKVTLAGERYHRMAMRGLAIVFGLLAAPIGVYIAVGDLAFPRTVVEGRVDAKEHYARRRGDKFAIIINGHQYDATREAYLPLRVGDRIHAELGAGSRTIFSAKRL